MVITASPVHPTVSSPLLLDDDAWALVTPEPSEAELIALRTALAEILRTADRPRRAEQPA